MSLPVVHKKHEHILKKFATLNVDMQEMSLLKAKSEAQLRKVRDSLSQLENFIHSPVKFENNKDYMVSLSMENTLKVWDMVSKECVKTVNSIPEGYSCVEYMSANEFVCGHNTKPITVWNIQAPSDVVWGKF